jgi:hypothetical protein
MIISFDEIEQYRSELANFPGALAALEVLADCEGDLEDASISLAIQVGQEPNTSDRWIDGLAKRWRHVLCQAELKENLEDGLSGELLKAIAAETGLPMQLATAVAIYVSKANVEDFCKPLEEKL